MTISSTDDETFHLNRFNSWWQRLAYRHKWAEASLYSMFLSGLILWDRVDISWALERWVLLMHMLLGATVFSVILGAFWFSHRRLIKQSRKAFLRQTGNLIEVLLVLCCGSGFYLFFIGSPGQTLGIIIENVHFYSSWLLVPLVFRHAIRWTVLRLVCLRAS